MSTRTRLAPHVVISAGDMSGSLTSDPTVLQSLSIGSYQYKWAGTSPVGTVSLQASNDYTLNPDGTAANASTAKWTLLTVLYNGSAVTTVPVTGNTGSGLIEWETGANAIRTIYTFGSGVGSLTATVVAKVK